jgi:hypothetical protein
MIRRHVSSSRIEVLIGLVLLAGLVAQVQRAVTAREGKIETAASVPEPVRPSPGAAFAAVAPSEAGQGETLEALAARDPLGVIQLAMDRYDHSVRDYTCTFSKQERIGGELTKEQVISAYFREKPLSVRLEWKKNSDKITRALYVVDRWVEKGQQMAVVEPAGAIAQLFVAYVMRPINGEDAKKNSRRTIDQFGLRNSLTLTFKFAKLAQEKRILDFSYKGNSRVDGRTTLVFERRLPYTGEDGPWPDRVLVVHLDRELLVPVLCIAYADDDRKVLLGRYQCTHIKLNANLPDSVFTKEGMGF